MQTRKAEISREPGRTQTLQEAFLDALRAGEVPVSIYLVNGIKLTGQVHSFDQFSLTLKSAINQMVYKHAISTIAPRHDVQLSADKKV